MKSLERRFKKFEKKHSDWSTLVCFTESVKGQGFGKQAIHRWFKLVDKDDYDSSDKRAILQQLVEGTKVFGDNKKSG